MVDQERGHNPHRLPKGSLGLTRTIAGGDLAAGPPFIVCVERPLGSALAETMREIRAWLDHREIQTTSFELVSEGGGVGFDIGFKSEDEAELFRQEFGGVTSP